MFCRRYLLGISLVAVAARAGWCASGTEGASFLDIPVGGAPAALGSAYTAQATDVYAPVWNPAGLAFLTGVEFTGTHLSYLGPVYYEHASVVAPVGKDHETGAAPAGLGASVQYLGTGDLDARGPAGEPAGTFTSAFAAYSIAYGEKVSDKLGIGGTAKLITEKIADASASAYAVDVGLLYKPNAKLNVGAVLANVGSDIKFVNEADPLPTAGRLGATYQINPAWDISAESVYRKTGLASASLGAEWRYGEYFSFRGGYNTAHIKELGGGAGVTAGLGIFFWGQEFSYAYVPLGDLGSTHYFSLVFRLSTGARPEKPRLKAVDEDELDDKKIDEHGSHDSLYELLKEDDLYHDKPKSE